METSGGRDCGQSTTTNPLLKVEGLTVDLRIDGADVRLVDGVDLSVAPGETVALVGESGCGKTVTSLAIMRLLPANASLGGRVRFEGVDLTAMPDRELNRLRGSRMAMIFQEPRRSLNPAFTVGDQIAESIRQHLGLTRRQARTQAVDLLARVGIPNPAQRCDDYPHQFSGGMCQRVMLAVAVSCSPRLLIADEPTTALDVTVQRQVLQLIYDLQVHYELGVLLITHDLGVVAEFADRAVVMYAGSVVEESPVSELFDDPRHPYSAGLLQSMPDLRHRDTAMSFIPGVVPPPDALPGGCRFHPRCPFSVPGRCDTAAPPALEVGAGHRARCVRVGEIDLVGAFAERSTDHG